MVLLKSKYPAAPYSFFRVRNIQEARTEFLQNDVQNPTFKYGPYFDEQMLRRRLESLRQDLDNNQSDEAQTFLDDRISQTEFLLVAHQLQKEDNPSPQLIALFRTATTALYGPPSKAVTYAILKNLQDIASRYPKRNKYWQEITSRIRIKTNDNLLERPSEETLGFYRDALLKYAPWLAIKDTDLPRQPLDLITFAIGQIGADKLGWTARRVAGGSNAYTSYVSKTVAVGSHYKPRNFLALKQVVVHEVYGHVNRHIKSGGKLFAPDEAEGVAIVLEQLVKDKFSYLRTLRYLAVAIGWGTVGRPKDFRDTFEIVWRAAAILSGRGESVCKQRAFNECVRAFRGGHPEIPGAVFTKDIVYVEGNMRVWQWLQEQKLSYEAFINLIEGRRTVGESDEK